jgi:hypothetical protein
MASWTSDELDKIGATDEMRVASLRRDGSLRKPVTVWAVCHGDDVYVRSVNGRTAAWFRGAQVRHQGHLRAAGVDKDVDFVETENLADEIDAAYRTKYGRYKGIVPSILTPAARAATLKLVPR